MDLVSFSRPEIGLKSWSTKQFCICFSNMLPFSGIKNYARNWSQKLVHKTILYLFFKNVAIFWHQKLGQKLVSKIGPFLETLVQGLMVFLYQCP